MMVIDGDACIAICTYDVASRFIPNLTIFEIQICVPDVCVCVCVSAFHSTVYDLATQYSSLDVHPNHVLMFSSQVHRREIHIP